MELGEYVGVGLAERVGATVGVGLYVAVGRTVTVGVGLTDTLGEGETVGVIVVGGRDWTIVGSYFGTPTPDIQRLLRWLRVSGPTEPSGAIPTEAWYAATACVVEAL